MVQKPDPPRSVRILIVEDLPTDAELVEREVRKALPESEFLRVETRADFLAALETFRPDIILSDYQLPCFNGIEALNLTQGHAPEVPFILVTGSINEQTAVECMKAGAWDYVLKEHLQRIGAAAINGLEQKRMLREKKLADQALIESELKYRSLADSGRALIWTSGPDKLGDYFNQPWLLFTGHTLDQQLGNGWAEGVHPEDVDRCLQTYGTAFDRRERFSMEYRLRHASGEYRWILNDGTPRFDGSGNFVGYISHCLDITERKRAEAEIQTALAEKETLLRELYHRTKNNMQMIRAMLVLQACAHQNAELSAFVKEIEQRLLAMALVHQKLYQTQDLSQIDLHEYLAELADLLMQSYTVSPRHIALRSELEDVSVLIDTAIPCGLVFNEMMSNALKHAFPQGRAGEIRMRLRRTSTGMIELSFSDNGIGVPEGFDFRSQPSLGLQTIVALVEQQLKGEIRCDRRHGLAYLIRFTDNLYTARV